MRAQFVFSEMWIGLRRNLTMTIAVILTVAISLALFGIGLMIRSQVNSMKDYWFDKVEVSIFLCVKSSSSSQCQQNGPATKEQKQQIRRDLSSMPQVKKVYYESQQQAWDRFKRQFSDSPLLDSASPKDLPDSYRVKLKDPRKYAVVQSAVEGRPGVDTVMNEQHVLKRFFTILNKLRNAALGIFIALLIAGVLLISNTIRLAAYNRRRETGIMRLVGASNFFIQLPFLLEGAIAGLIGGVIAAIAVGGVQQFFVEPLQQSTPTVAFLGWGAVAQIIVVQIVVGVLLCGLASLVTLRKYLRV
ncbi:MAG: permease-like cell division protein FtsX [Streptosporangiaceae bacterium]